MAICKTCLITDSFPNVTFDEGICSFCKVHDRCPKVDKHGLGRDQLLKILTSEKPRTYDCAVPVSGGKDSSYALFYIVRELGLKPLALFFDHAFMTDAAKKNVERLCRKLAVELVTGKATKFRRKLIVEALHLSRWRGRFAKLCTNCENDLRAFAINEATKRNVRFLVWGSTDFEDPADTFLDPESPTWRQQYVTTDGTLERITRGSLRLLRSRAGVVHTCAATLHYARHMYYCVRDNVQMKAPEGWSKFNPFMKVTFDNKHVTPIYFFDYIDYDPYAYIATLKKTVGWEAPAGRESRMDCKLHCFSNYQHLNDTGITMDGFTSGVLVRHGLLSRTEAIENEELLQQCLPKEVSEMSRELGVDTGL